MALRLAIGISIEYSLTMQNQEYSYGARLFPLLENQIVVIIRNITERKQAEAVLRTAHAELEQRVEQRTAELTRANDRLKAEIAERKQAEAALQESEARLRALIDNLPFEFWAMDSDLRYVMQNAVSLKNYGGVVGKRIYELGIPAEVTAAWVEQDLQALHGRILREEYERGVEGERKAYENLVAPVIVGDTAVGIVGVAIEVTERKRAEEALRQAHARLEQRVEKRTAELARANASLKAEIAEQKWAEAGRRSPMTPVPSCSTSKALPASFAARAMPNEVWPR